MHKDLQYEKKSVNLFFSIYTSNAQYPNQNTLQKLPKTTDAKHIIKY